MAKSEASAASLRREGGQSGSGRGQKVSENRKITGGLGGLGGPSGAMQGSKLEDRAAIPHPETVDAMKSILSLVQGLAEKTIVGFKEVSDRLNQQPTHMRGDVDGDLTGLQDALDSIVKKIDDLIAANADDEVYIIIPGHDTKTLTTEEAAEVIKDKSVRVFGGIGTIASSIADKMRDI